ncbi:MAG: ubiquinol-cytochrome C reductase [Propionibacterium sp.]|nr:MAG: ubiquinol-cytochrome C reductase [Propionibacterium sp.]
MTLDTKATHPVPDPGLEPHEERYSDANPAVGDRAYRQVVTMFALVPVLAIAFVVVYFAIPKEWWVDFGPLHAGAQHLLLGITGGFAVMLVGIGAVHWARQIMGDEEIIDERHPARSSDEDREATVAEFQKGVEQSGIGRRKLLGSSLAGGLGILAVPALVTLADLGPWPTKAMREKTIEKTIWAKGVHLVTEVTYRRIKADEIAVGQLINAEPENLQELHGVEFQQARAKSPIIVVRMDPASIKVPESRKDWQVDGILSYSKICTHVGCPVSLWERRTHHLLCPCHQSTFDLADSGVVVFGPAARSLPQLPIQVDSEGYLVARSDFTVPVGPSYFERDSREDYEKGER